MQDATSHIDAVQAAERALTLLKCLKLTDDDEDKDYEQILELCNDVCLFAERKLGI